VPPGCGQWRVESAETVCFEVCQRCASSVGGLLPRWEANLGVGKRPREEMILREFR
jgi:hypothetical protein